MPAFLAAAARGRRRPPAARGVLGGPHRWSPCAGSTGSLVREGLADADPAADVRPPGAAPRLPKALPVDDVERLLERGRRAGDTPAGAARPGAARGALRHRRADLRGGRARRRRPRPATTGTVLLRGKGGKERLVPVGRYAVEARRGLPGAGPARRWPRAGTGTPALFLNARGGRLSRQSAWTVLRRPPSGPGVGRRRVAAHPAALVRHPPARRRRRRAGGAGAARPRVGDHHPDLHAGHRGQRCARSTPPPTPGPGLRSPGGPAPRRGRHCLASRSA